MRFRLGVLLAALWLATATHGVDAEHNEAQKLASKNLLRGDDVSFSAPDASATGFEAESSDDSGENNAAVVSPDTSAVGPDSVIEKRARDFESKADKAGRSQLMKRAKKLTHWGSSLTQLATRLRSKQADDMKDFEKRMNIDWGHSDGLSPLKTHLSPQDVLSGDDESSSATSEAASSTTTTFISTTIPQEKEESFEPLKSFSVKQAHDVWRKLRHPVIPDYKSLLEPVTTAKEPTLRKKAIVTLRKKAIVENPDISISTISTSDDLEEPDQAPPKKKKKKKKQKRSVWKQLRDIGNKKSGDQN